jgi:hypothetical protein
MSGDDTAEFVVRTKQRISWESHDMYRMDDKGSGVSNQENKEHRDHWYSSKQRAATCLYTNSRQMSTYK